MSVAFYFSAAVALIATVLAITRRDAVHALLYLIVSLLAVAVIFFTLGAPFIAALEVIIYAGAIMVLFIFVVMMLNLGTASIEQESRWLSPGVWIGPAILAIILVLELAYMLSYSKTRLSVAAMVSPIQVGLALFGPYLLGIELASILLLAGLVGAYHLGRRDKANEFRGGKS
jgi:NADH-quinone oxidoreductase subunit J